MNQNYKILSQINNQFTIDNIKYDSSIQDDSVKIPKIFFNSNWKNFIPSPPKNSSKLTIAEINEIARLSNYRTQEDESLILLVDKEPIDLFDSILKKHGRPFPKTLFNNIYKDVYPLVMAIKNYYNRPRPEQLAKIYKIPINVFTTKTHQTPSYPSGHTVYSCLAYLLLKHLYPNIPDLELATPMHQTGKARMIQGIHYRSDIEAAIDLTNKIFNNYIINNLGDYK